MSSFAQHYVACLLVSFIFERRTPLDNGTSFLPGTREIGITTTVKSNPSILLALYGIDQKYCIAYLNLLPGVQAQHFLPIACFND